MEECKIENYTRSDIKNAAQEFKSEGGKFKHLRWDGGIAAVAFDFKDISYFVYTKDQGGLWCTYEGINYNNIAWNSKRLIDTCQFTSKNTQQIMEWLLDIIKS